MHRHLLCLFWLTACLSVLLASAQRPSTSPAPKVALSTGILEGTNLGSEQNSSVFLGIPYAAPPVGGLRWKPPQLVKGWQGTREATHFGAPCPQLPAKWFPYIGWSEDCLYLNVWTPQLSGGAKLPVLVYFHGGSNTQGYSQMTPLGPPLAKLGLVVVSANYRLGPFGFLAHPALTAESRHHSSGNYGLLDQLHALKWVRENISRFGGDPLHVTVMGQSSGAVDVCLLMASPLAKGLLRAAIMQSGECQGTLNEDIRTPIPYNSIVGTGEGVGERLAHDLGITDGPQALQKLRSISPDEILKAWSRDKEVHFDAIVDGWIIPKQPAEIFAEGKQMHVPVLVGSNADEATVFGHNDVKTVEQYKNYLHADTGRFSDQEFKAYPVHSDAEVPARYLQLQADTFAYGAYSMAKAMARAGQEAYLYYFTYVDTGSRATLGAHHGLELFFLSDSFPDGWESSPDDNTFGYIMRNYWAHFVKTGDPNFTDAPPWPPHKEHQHFELGRNTGVRPVPGRLVAMEGIMRRISAETSANKP